MRFPALSRFVLLALLGSLALAPASRALDEWTILAYMSGDDDSKNPVELPQINALLDSAKYVPAGGAVNFVAQADRGPKVTAELRRKYYDPDYQGATRWDVAGGKVTEREKLGEVNMGDPRTLWSFLEWGVRNYPAKRYLLVIAGHGSGVLSWRGPGSVSSANPGEVRFGSGDRFVAYDDTDDDTLTVWELREVLAAFRDRLNGGRKLDVLALDACLPGGIEALYELRDGVDYFVGSPSLTYYGAFPYASLANWFSQEPTVSPRALCEWICKGFIDRSRNQHPDAMQAWRTDLAEELVSVLSRLAVELILARQELGKVSFQKVVAYWDAPHLYWDLGKIADSIRNGWSTSTRASNGQAILDIAGELKTVLGQARVAGWYDGSFADDKVGGLSIFWGNPEQYGGYRNYYKALSFSRDGRWDEFLDAFVLGM